MQVSTIVLRAPNKWSVDAKLLSACDRTTIERQMPVCSCNTSTAAASVAFTL
jgi:hypothetical protein